MARTKGDEGMNSREDFDKWYPRAWLDYGGDIHAITLKAWQEATERQQKIIDELKNDLEDCTIKKLSTEQEIERLKIKNPDVICPECGNPDDKQMICTFCHDKGTVPITKAQEYRIKELEEAETALKAGKHE